MTWKCEMGSECESITHVPEPDELQWSSSGLDSNKGFYCTSCAWKFDIPFEEDAPFLSDILNAAKVEVA